MNKDEILNREYTAHVEGNAALLMRLFPQKDKSVVLAAMDEYASLQRVEIVEWLRKQPISIMNKTSQQIDSQFIEQQTKYK